MCDHGIEEQIAGYTYGQSKDSIECSNINCKCVRRLKIGSKIAQEIRGEIFKRFGITTSCGISWNKLLSKVVGSQNKPNKQTTLLPNHAKELIFELKNLKKIPGIGSTTFKRLQENHLKTPEDVWNTNIENLLDLFPESSDLALKIKLLCEGIDDTPVKESSAKPLSIGLEDRFKPLVSELEVKNKLTWLLNRLIQLLQEDGRLPRTLKVTVRDAFKDHKLGKHKFHKESRQCKINPKLFSNLLKLNSSDVKQEIVGIGMSLTRKMVDFNEQVQLTLLGISVTDFLVSGKGIMTYFEPNNANRDEGPSGELMKQNSQPQNSCDVQLKTNVISKKLDPIDSEVKISADGLIKDVESIKNDEVEIPEDCDPDVFSQLPFEIQQELLNTTKSNKRFKDINAHKDLSLPTNPSRENGIIVPKDWDKDVFQSLPEEIKSELLKGEKTGSSASKNLKRGQHKIDNYFGKKCARKTN